MGVALLTELGDGPLDAADVLVGASKPPPKPFAGAVMCSRAVDAGRLVACQLRLAEAVVAGDVGAAALLADVLDWAAGLTEH